MKLRTQNVFFLVKINQIVILIKAYLIEYMLYQYRLLRLELSGCLHIPLKLSFNILVIPDDGQVGVVRQRNT